MYSFGIEVYNCGVKILKLGVREKKKEDEERFSFKVKYFNPQTDNDCYSINHIIAVCSESIQQKDKNTDRGNAEIIKNQFVFRKKDNYYSYVKVWKRGDVLEDNFDKYLSYEFATDEYLNYVKKIFEIKKMPRRKIKALYNGFLDKMILLEGLK